MTFKIKMLTAAAMLSLPAMAAAQAVGGQPDAQPPAEAGNPPVQPSESTTAQPPMSQPEDSSTPEMEAANPVQQSDNLALPPADSSAPPPAASAPPADATPPANAAAPSATVTQATAADITAGAAVRDQAGGSVGTIESVSATGAVVSTGTVRAEIPLTSFGKNGQGLVIAMTKAQLEAAAGAQTPTPAG